MEIQLYPDRKKLKKCLILVGGSGDSIDSLQPLVRAISNVLPEHLICSFTFSSESNVDLLKQQSVELQQVLSKLESNCNFDAYDIFATSMGAYATVELLQDKQVCQKINSVIFFDPADYYQNLKIKSADEEITWSGYQPYKPIKPTISDKLMNLSTHLPSIHVVHCIVRNHGINGYVDSTHTMRDIDHSEAYSRLSTNMVKAFLLKAPFANQGQYLEVNNMPHGFLRDGNIQNNITIVASLIKRLLTSSLTSHYNVEITDKNLRQNLPKPGKYSLVFRNMFKTLSDNDMATSLLIDCLDNINLCLYRCLTDYHLIINLSEQLNLSQQDRLESLRSHTFCLIQDTISLVRSGNHFTCLLLNPLSNSGHQLSRQILAVLANKPDYEKFKTTINYARNLYDHPIGKDNKTNIMFIDNSGKTNVLQKKLLNIHDDLVNFSGSVDSHFYADTQRFLQLIGTTLTKLSYKPVTSEL